MTFLTPKIVINTPIVITRVMDTFTDTYIYIFRCPWSTSATSENEQFKVDIPGNLFREVNPTVFCRA